MKYQTLLSYKLPQVLHIDHHQKDLFGRFFRRFRDGINRQDTICNILLVKQSLFVQFYSIYWCVNGTLSLQGRTYTGYVIVQKVSQP